MPTPEPAPHRPADSPLRAFLRARTDGRGDPPESAVAALLAAIGERHGAAVQAVLAYGSWLRGKRDTVLDFYVVLDDYRSLPAWQRPLAQALAPNVYHLGAELDDATRVRAKYAVVTPARFLRGARRDFHSYFWARFAQPCRLLYARDGAAVEAVLDVLEAAPRRFVRAVLPCLPERFDTHTLWCTGLGLTYRCELRSEKRDQAAALFEAGRGYFEPLTALLAGEGIGFCTDAEGFRQPARGRMRTLASRVSWRMRATLGKLLSVARVAKAATTFEAPLEYLLWKIERHSGLRVQPSPRQLRHPLLFAWPLLWRLYRQGAFR